MRSGYEEPSAPAGGDPEDEDLRRLIEIVVRDFNGDTAAFFDSLRQPNRLKDSESEELESKIALRFAKSI